MRKQFIRNRKVRYGGMTVLLTVLLIAATVLANVLFGTLARRYGWYVSMNAGTNYGVTGKCYQLLETMLNAAEERNGERRKVEIIFCDLPENLEKSDTGSFIYHTACSLAERFPNDISVTCYDIWLNPANVREYLTSVVLDPETGLETEQKVSLKSTSVILTCGSYHRVYSNTEFYVFEGGNLSNVWAYNGEKKLTAGILHALRPDSPVVCLTNNHGEAYYDYELIYLLDDAGYRIDYVDLSKDPIPAACNLLICYNPNKDLTVSDHLSDLSEPDLLNDFLSVPGNIFLAFIEDGTPELPNLEAFLAGWGVSACYHTTSAGVRYRYMVQDTSGSLTSDGYTIYGKPSDASGLLDGLSPNVVFKNATALRAAQGFIPVPGGTGGVYENGDHSRTLYALWEGGNGAVSWANGAPVDGDRVMLATLTEQKLTGGSSYVGVFASADFATESFLQSAVYGNTDALLRLLGKLGSADTPEGLTVKPFRQVQMSLVTTAEKFRWTVVLAATPAVVILTAAVIILVRRKHS